jgi:hypothetical protein
VARARLPHARSRRAASWRRIGTTSVILGGGCAFGGDRGDGCASGGDREVDARPALLREADVRPTSTGRRMHVRRWSGRRMCVRRRQGGGCVSDVARGSECASDIAWGGEGASGVDREADVCTVAAAYPSQPLLGFNGRGSTSVGSERMDSISIRSGGRATVGSQWDPHVRHGQHDENDVGGLH